MNFQRIYFSVLNGVWPGNDVMHLGAPKEKKNSNDKLFCRRFRSYSPGWE